MKCADIIHNLQIYPSSHAAWSTDHLYSIELFMFTYNIIIIGME